MRLLCVVVLAGLPGAAVAQEAATLLQKAPSAPILDASITPEDKGIPAAADAPKVGELVAAKAAEGQLSDFDTDKVAGNAPLPAPLAERQKAPSLAEPDTGETNRGEPATPLDPKVADVAVSHAQGQPSIYDDDKIVGNETGEGFTDGPLTERQKLASALAEGTDPSSFGQPAADAAKEAALAVSKAELNTPNIEDNDKIAGNPYTAPPLLPREKLPSALPDPVADADMGQPATDAPKVALAVSKAAEGRPNIEDNDKIDGNPVVNPPLADRSKGPAFEPALAGLSDDELGLPLTPDAAKVADVGVSKLAEAVATEYDEDKIAGNAYQDPYASGTDDFSDPEPPAELIAQVRALLDDPATRTAAMAGAGTRAPAPVAAAFQSFLGILYDAPEVRDRMALAMARVFMDVGLTPGEPAAVGRMAAEFLAGFGEHDAWLGTARRSIDEQRSYLADLLRVGEGLPPEQCAPYLDGTMDAGQQRQVLLTAIAGWTEEERNRVFIHRAAAILAEVQDTPPFTPMSAQDAATARASLGAAALAAIDAAENGTDLLAAFGDPTLAMPEHNCAVQKLILGAALAKTGAEGDLAVRYLVENGWSS